MRPIGAIHITEIVAGQPPVDERVAQWRNARRAVGHTGCSLLDLSKHLTDYIFILPCSALTSA